MRTLAAIATGSILLLGAGSPARASDVDLFAVQCGGCHNNLAHPGNLVFNAAANAALIETVNGLGMGAPGSPADHMSIAAYLDTVKPTIVLAPVAHDSPGTVIPLGDVIVSGAEAHTFLKVIESIQTVTPPTKGTVYYRWANGFAQPSTVTYTPFPGQSGTDTWTYQGIGARGNTTIRTASVSIASTAVSFAPIPGVWWNPNQPGSGLGLDYKDGMLVAEVYSYLPGGASQWYLAAGPLTNNVFTATLDKYTGGQCISCAYANPGPPVGNDGTITITFTSPTTATADLPGGRHIQIERYFKP